MGLAVDPDFATNRTIYACHGWRSAGTKDVRVTAWTIDADLTSATIARTVVTGINIEGGKHAGCRVRFDPDGALYVSTGDSRTGPLPQDLTSLNGKVLKVDPATGGPWPGNPFQDAEDPSTRLIWTYGHRNPQGLAYRSGPGVRDGMWSAEHGPTRDDEVNRLKPGASYGWNPMPDYFEDAPRPTTRCPASRPTPAGARASRPWRRAARPGWTTTAGRTGTGGWWWRR